MAYRHLCVYVHFSTEIVQNVIKSSMGSISKKVKGQCCRVSREEAKERALEPTSI